ncbi:MAG: glycosyl hydrolase family 18 protein [Bacteroidota bacterium]
MAPLARQAQRNSFQQAVNMRGGGQFRTVLGTAWILSLLVACGAPAPAVPPAPTPIAVPGGRAIIGYYPSWAAGRGAFVKDIPAGKLTHINYAFSNVSPNGECILGDPAADVERVYSAAESVDGQGDPESAPFHGNFNQLLELKSKYPHLKVLISIGGWSWSGNFSAAAGDAAARQRFAASCIDLYLSQFKNVFDGLDIDWEYPVGGGLSSGRAEDKGNFTLLLAELRRQLNELGAVQGRAYLLTIAVPAGPGVIRNFELEKAASSVDWMNLMGYDLHGTWEPTTNFNAPLFEAPGDPAGEGLTIDAAVQAYLAAGVPAEKLVLGVPFYGHGWAGVPDVDHGLYQPAAGAAPGTWEAGAFEYKDIRKKYASAYQRYWDSAAYVPWLYDPQSRIFISYEDPQSLEAKAGYARDQRLAGLMIWELTQGDETLLDALHKGLAAGGPPRPTPLPKLSVPRPFEKEMHPVSGITIDGQLGDWPVEPDFILNDPSQIAYSLAPKSWGGPQDLSAEAWAGWAPEGLYFAFRVVDDVHVQTKADSDLWHGDHMELQFDTLLEKDYTNPGMNDDDYQIGLSIGDADRISPAAFAWFNGPDAPGPVAAVKMAHTLTSDGYILEAFLPGSMLASLTLAEGATFGMNISPSDTDSAGQGQKVMLSTSAIRTYADPRTFGKITLVK